MLMLNKLDRRKFIKNSAKAAVGLSIPFLGSCGSQKCCFQNQVQHPAEGKMIWGNLIHLGYNMWADRPVDKWTDDPDVTKNAHAHPYLRCDESLWNDILKKMSDVGMNMVVIDIGEAIAYKSHPELGVENSWTHKKIREELAKIRDLGIEPIPKLNFSAGHDTWLKEYGRMVSTKKYYEVCSDIIEEVSDIFDRPRFFHLGYDEEAAIYQRKYNYVVIRQHELWWHDFNFFVDQVRSHKVRPWIWSDYVWRHPEEFYNKMPKDVLQSNWYYGTDFNKYPGKFGDSEKEKFTETRIKSYIELDKAGFEQVPTGSNWALKENFSQTVDFCKKHVSEDGLKGFLQVPWFGTLEVFRKQHMEAIDIVAQEIAKWKANG
jgi:hypothetical protein